MKTKLPYYNFDKMESFNGIYNMVVAARGNGKTYGRKYKAIRAAIKKGDQFFYLRRFTTELKGVDTFFNDIAIAFPDWDFRVNAGHFEMAPMSTKGEKKRQWQLIGYYGALTQAANFKSMTFPKVKTIIFDEFIIERGFTQYLNDETRKFTDFFNTIDRTMDKTRVWFLANTVSIDNPYFLKYDILPEAGDEFIVKADGFIVCHFVNDDAFKEAVYSTRFGQFIAGTDYAEYAVEGVFRDNHKTHIEDKSPEARYHFTIETRKGSFSVWIDMMAGPLFYLDTFRPKQEVLYTMLPERVSEERTYISKSDKISRYLQSAWRTGKMYFDKPPTRNAFLEMMKR